MFIINNRIWTIQSFLGFAEVADLRRKLNVVLDAVVGNIESTVRERVRAIGRLGLADLVRLHVALVPNFSAGMNVSGWGDGKVRNHIGVVNNSVGFRDHHSVVFGKSIVTDSASSKSIDSVSILIEFFDVGSSKGGEDSAKTVSGYENFRTSVQPMKTFDVVEDSGFYGWVEFEENFGDLAVGAFIVGDFGGFEVFNEGVDVVGSSEDNNYGAEGSRVSGIAYDSAGEVDEGFGLVDFVVLAEFAVPGVDGEDVVVGDGWEVGHFEGNGRTVGGLGLVEKHQDDGGN